MTDTSCHGMDGLPRSRIHAMMMCPPCPRTPVSHVSGLNSKRTIQYSRTSCLTRSHSESLMIVMTGCPAFAGHDGREGSLQLPRFLGQHDRDAVADRIG